jgi:hypothetical protein
MQHKGLVILAIIVVLLVVSLVLGLVPPTTQVSSGQ